MVHFQRLLFAVAVLLGTAVQGEQRSCLDLQRLLWKGPLLVRDLKGFMVDFFFTDVYFKRAPAWVHNGTDHNFWAYSIEANKDLPQIHDHEDGVYELEKLSVIPLDFAKSYTYYPNHVRRDLVAKVLGRNENFRRIMGIIPGKFDEYKDGTVDHDNLKSFDVARVSALQVTFKDPKTAKRHSVVVPLIARKSEEGTNTLGKDLQINEDFNKNLRGLASGFYYEFSLHWLGPYIAANVLRKNHFKEVNTILDDFPNLYMSMICAYISEDVLKPFFEQYEAPNETPKFSPENGTKRKFFKP